jgi:PAS domain S-box-containing protein
MAEPSSRAPDSAVAAPRRRAPWLAMLALLLLIGGISAVAIHFAVERNRDTETARLQAIAALTAQQVSDWLKERMGDARMVSSSRYLAENYDRWRITGDAASLDNLRHRLTDYQRQYQLGGVMLLDESAALIWQTEGGTHGIDAGQQRAFLAAARSGQVARRGPYLDADGRIHLDFIAPLNGGKRGIVVLHTGTEDYLPAVLRTWPGPSASGEVLLLRREAGHVLLLNEPRQRTGQVLQQGFPVSRESLLAARAVAFPPRLGELLHGEGFRGEPVFGVAQAIPDSDWILLAKLDHAEFHAAARVATLWIALAGLLGMFITTAGLFLSRQRQQLAIAGQVQTAQNERLRALHLLAAIADSSSDAIFAKDLRGRYLLFNRAAQRITGKALDEVLGRDDSVLFSEEQAQRVMRNDQEVIAANLGITFQEELATSSGMATFLATKGPLRDESGQILGIYGISRDISERKRAESLFAATARFVSSVGGEDFFPALVRQAAEMLRLDAVYIALLDASRQRAETLAAWQDDEWLPNWAYDLAGTPCAEVVEFTECRVADDVLSRYPEVAYLKRIGAQAYIGEALLDRDGQAIGVIVGVSRLPLRDAELLPANLRILAARAAAEWLQRQTTQALRDSERSFRLLTEQVPAIIYRATPDVASRTLYVSPRVTDLGYSQSEWTDDPDAWRRALHPDDQPRVDAALAAFQALGGKLSMEYRLREKQGGWRYFQDEAQILHDETGRPLYLQGLLLDVTARHEVDAQLAAARAEADMLADLLNRSAQPFGQGFDDGHMGFHNQALLDLLGYSAEEFARLDWLRDLTPPEWLPELRLRMEELRRGGQPVSFEMAYLRKDGARLPIEMLAHLIRDAAGRPKYFYAFITDISKRKQAEASLLRQAEELRQRNEELERFNRASVGRELDMIQLKQRINALARELGRPPPYDLSFAASPSPDDPP